MVDYWSLVIFTVLGQSAAGLMILLALSRRETRPAAHRAWVAVIVLILAALASLGHLADPTISYYAILNVTSSWLSREILFAGLFGLSMIIWLIFRRCWLLWLAALVGVAFVYVMSRVYMIPTEPLWNSALTFWSFLATAVLLGGSLLLLLDELGAGCRAGGVRRALLGWLPIVVAIAMGFRLVFLLLQMTRPHPATDEAMWLEIAEIALLVAGGGLGMLLLARRATHLDHVVEQAVALPPAQPEPLTRIEVADEEATLAEEKTPVVVEKTRPAGPRACGLTFWTLVAVALIWAAEICGRVLFYKSYVWFGM